MRDTVLTGGSEKRWSGLRYRMLLLTAKEWETQDSDSTNWDVAVVDDGAKSEIRYGENENKSKFRRYEIDFTARQG
jgi:hypothetical protein